MLHTNAYYSRTTSVHTKYYSSTTLYYIVLLQYYNSTTPVVRLYYQTYSNTTSQLLHQVPTPTPILLRYYTDTFYSSTYSVPTNRTTPVPLLRTTKYYKVLLKVRLCTTQYLWHQYYSWPPQRNFISSFVWSTTYDLRPRVALQHRHIAILHQTLSRDPHERSLRPNLALSTTKSQLYTQFRLSTRKNDSYETGLHWPAPDRNCTHSFVRSTRTIFTRKGCTDQIQIAILHHSSRDRHARSFHTTPGCTDQILHEAQFYCTDVLRAKTFRTTTRSYKKHGYIGTRFDAKIVNFTTRCSLRESPLTTRVAFYTQAPFPPDTFHTRQLLHQSGQSR